MKISWQSKCSVLILHQPISILFILSKRTINENPSKTLKYIQTCRMQMHSQRRSRNPNGNHYKLSDLKNIKSDFNAKSHSAFNNHETSRRKYIRRAQTFASNTQFSLVGIRKGFFEGDDGEGKSALRQTHKTHSFDCHKIKKSEIL